MSLNVEFIQFVFFVNLLILINRLIILFDAVLIPSPGYVEH